MRQAAHFLHSLKALPSAGCRQIVVRPTVRALSASSSDSADYGVDDAPTQSRPPIGAGAEQALEQTGDLDASAEQKRKALQQSLKDGTLGLGLSAGGFLYCYHLGVLWELAKLGILPPPDKPGAIKLAGASAGSLAAATFACGLDVGKATTALFEFAADCRSNGTQGRLGLLLRDFLHAYFPDDAHERCRDLTYISITRVFPMWRPVQVHRFHDKDDLVQALITSCHIPYYANGEWMTKFRGKYCVDGGVAAFIPSPPTDTVVKVCCFPVNEVLSKVQPSVQNYQRVASLLDVAISPDAYESWSYSYQQLLNWALVPADNETLTSLINKGRKDARAWAEALKLVEPGHDDVQGVTGSAKAETVLASPSGITK